MAAEIPEQAARCPECGRGTLVPERIDDTFDFDLGDEAVKVQARNIPVERCTHCGTVLSGPPAARVRHEAVCQAAGLLTPTQVKALRHQLNLSQEELAQLAGVGVATISRIERGRLIQNRSTDNLLFLMAHSAEVRRLLAERLAAHPRPAPTPPVPHPIGTTPSPTR